MALVLYRLATEISTQVYELPMPLPGIILSSSWELCGVLAIPTTSCMRHALLEQGKNRHRTLRGELRTERSLGLAPRKAAAGKADVHCRTRHCAGTSASPEATSASSYPS